MADFFDEIPEANDEVVEVPSSGLAALPEPEVEDGIA